MKLCYGHFDGKQNTGTNNMIGNKRIADIEKVVNKTGLQRLELIIHAAELARSRNITARQVLDVYETEDVNGDQIVDQIITKLQREKPAIEDSTKDDDTTTQPEQDV